MSATEWSRRKPGRIFNGLAWTMIALVAVQVYLAGYAVTANPAAWAWHTAFVNAIELAAIALAAIAGFSKSPRRLLWLSLSLLGLVWLQYLFIHLPSGYARALHPMNAVAIAIVSWMTAWTSRSTKENKP